MKKNVLFLSLLLGASIQLNGSQGSFRNWTQRLHSTISNKLTPSSDTQDSSSIKNSIKNSLKTLTQRFNSTVSNKPTIVPTPKKIAPPVAAKPMDHHRNLLILLDNRTINAFSNDIIFTDFLQNLYPSNYTILVSDTLIQTLINKYHLLHDILDKKTDYQTIEDKYPTTDTKRLIVLLRKHFNERSTESDTTDASILEKELQTISNLMRNTLDQWTIYKTKNESYVLMPKEIQESSNLILDEQYGDKLQEPTKQSSYFSIAELSSPQTLSEFIKQSPAKQLHGLSGDMFLTDLRKLIKGDRGTIIPRPLNVVLTGHGSHNKKETENVMAGLTMQHFKKFIQFLETANTYSFFYTTCYGGGKNSVDIFNTELPYIVVAHGISDTTVKNTYMAFEHLELYFKYITTSLDKALGFLTNINQQKNNQQQELILNDYKIRLPKTNWFTLAQMHQKIQTIGKTKALTASLNRKPIILTDKPCGLLFPTLPTLKIPKNIHLPLIMGIAPSTGGMLYAIKDFIIEQSHDDIKDIMKTLDYIFEQYHGKKTYTSGFYIEQLTVGNQTFNHILIDQESILIKYVENKRSYIIQVDRSDIRNNEFYPQYIPLEGRIIPPLEQFRKTFYKTIEIGQERLKNYATIVKSRTINTQNYPDKKSDFALLRQALVTLQTKDLTESVIKELKEKIKESNLSRSERAALESILKYRISES
jgi:hypothetical protein